MKWPIRVTRIKHSDANYHGPGGEPLRSCVKFWSISSQVWAWRPSIYNRHGEWWYFDIFFPWFRRR